MERTESVHANSDARNQLQDSRKSKLYNLLLPFNLHHYEDEVPLDWRHSQCDRQTPLSHNGYILSLLLYYQLAEDEELPAEFEEDFSEWEDKDWKTANKNFVLALHTTLASRGCYIDNVVITGSLVSQQAQKDSIVTIRSPALQQIQTQEDSTVTTRSPALQQIQTQEDSTVTARSPALQQEDGTVTAVLPVPQQAQRSRSATAGSPVPLQVQKDDNNRNVAAVLNIDSDNNSNMIAMPKLPQPFQLLHSGSMEDSNVDDAFHAAAGIG